MPAAILERFNCYTFQLSLPGIVQSAMKDDFGGSDHIIGIRRA